MTVMIGKARLHFDRGLVVRLDKCWGMREETMS